MKLFTALLVLIFCAALGFAQTPGQVQFPGALDTPTSLFEAKDNASTTLTLSVDSGATTANVTSTTKFPTTGAIVVNSEVIFYTGKTSTTFIGLIRAREGTNAAAHSAGALVRGPILAAHHNTLVLAEIASQTKVGAGSSTPAANTVLRGTGPGTSAWGALVASDVPSLDASKITTGTLGDARLPTTLAGKTLTSPTITGTATTGAITSSGTITATAFVGNGAGLTSLSDAAIPSTVVRGGNNLTDLTSASTARANLGLGTLSTQSASSVNVTGGTLSNITCTNCTNVGSATAGAFSATGDQVINYDSDANSSGVFRVQRGGVDKLVLNNDGTANFSGKVGLGYSTPTANLHHQIDSTATYWQKIRPLTRIVDFNWGESSTVNTNGTRNNEVVMFGWNLNPGGGPDVAGENFSGMSFESYYKPGADAALMETHWFFGSSTGTQFRPLSFLFARDTNYTQGLIKADRVQFYNQTGTTPYADFTPAFVGFTNAVNIDGVVSGFTYLSRNGADLPIKVIANPVVDSIYATRFGTATKGVQIGYNATSNVGAIQSVTYGVQVENLALNPSGGRVLVGTTTDDGATRLQVSGGAALSGNLSVGTGTVLGGSAIKAIKMVRQQLDFGSIAAQQSAELTITVAGIIADDSQTIMISTSSFVGANYPRLVFTAYPSATDTVKVRVHNYGASAVDPANDWYRITIIQY